MDNRVNNRLLQPVRQLNQAQEARRVAEEQFDVQLIGAAPRVRTRPAREPTLFLTAAAGLAFGSCLTQMGLIIVLRPLQRAGVPDAVLEAAMKLLFALFALGTIAVMAEATRISYMRWRNQQ